MGLNFSGSLDRARHPERYPEKEKGPTFDTVGYPCGTISTHSDPSLVPALQMYGFPEGRKAKGTHPLDSICQECLLFWSFSSSCTIHRRRDANAEYSCGQTWLLCPLFSYYHALYPTVLAISVWLLRAGTTCLGTMSNKEVTLRRIPIDVLISIVLFY